MIDNTHTFHKKPIGLFCWLFVMSMVLASCTRVTGELKSEKELESIVDAFSEPTPAAQLSPVAGGRLLAQDDTRATSKRFNISVNNIPAQMFFLSLVSDAGVNVVTDPEISGTISLELKDVTVSDVLKVTRDVYGYEYSFDNNVYIIYPRKLRTEIFDINYLNVVREGSTETSVAINAIASGNSAGNNNNTTGGEQATNQAAATTQAASGTTVTTKTSTDFWVSVEETVKAIVGEGEGRSIVINPQASIVVVKALPKELNRIRRFLDRVESNVKRQIILETKIIEVVLDDNYQAGINWEQFAHQMIYTNNTTGISSSGQLAGFAESGEMFSSGVVVNDLFSLLAFLETQGSTQVLSSPRVSTVNNQKAIIRVGTDEFFVTGVSTNTTANATATVSSPDVELTSFFSGISLDITPQISADGDVILHVHPLVSAVSDQQKEFTIGNDKFDLPLALREVRESDSIVRARSGEVVVLGGLMQESSSYQDGKRPLLGDIPILNLFFKTKSDQKQKKELVILMRPIVVNDSTWQDDIRNSRTRFENLGHEIRMQD